MNNCKVTTFKASVNNNDLPFLGRVKVYFDTVETASNLSQGLRKVSEMFTDGKMEVKGDIFFANSSLQSLGTQVINSASYSDSNIYVTNGKGVLLLDENITSISSIAGAASAVKGYYLKLDEFKNITTLQGIAVAKSLKTEGDIKYISQNTGLTTLNVSSTQVYGKIRDIECLTALTYLSLGNTGVQGVLKDFAISQIDNHGRTSGTLVVAASNDMRVNEGRTCASNVEYTITYTDATHFSISGPSFTISYAKSGGIWSIVE
jgi:hypothetical protein